MTEVSEVRNGFRIIIAASFAFLCSNAPLNLSQNARLGMVEAIVHLLNRDYAEIGGDFVNLEFIPEGTDVRPIVPALTTVFDAALAGGGGEIGARIEAACVSLVSNPFPYPLLLAHRHPQLRALTSRRLQLISLR